MTAPERNIRKRGVFCAQAGLLASRLALAALLCAGLLCPSQSFAQKPTQVSAESAGTSAPSPETPREIPPTIVVGFLGGYVSGNSPIRSEVKMAQRLRTDYKDNVRIETFANRDMNDAYKRILKFFGAGEDGKLSDQQKRQARIIVFGHSWGGTATVSLARKLQKEGIPVLLTVQVDSVEHWYVDDSVIPANVEKAANFYQSNGLLRGREKISAADPVHTKILGNYRFDYTKNPVACQGYPFWDRWFSKTHMEIECDPKVWKEVESLIRAELPPPAR